MKKISFLSLHLGYGGIEKAICSLANSLCDEYEVEILATYKTVEQPAFFLDDRIKVRYLTDVKPNGREWKDALKHFKVFSLVRESFKSVNVLRLRSQTMAKAVRESDSDVIISSRYLFNDILAKNAREGVFKVGWEHNHYSISQKHEKHVRESIKNLDAFVCCSKDITEHYKPYTSNCLFIPNSIDYYPDQPNELDTLNLISVGRFSKEKGYTDMIDVFDIIHQEYSGLKLDLIGDGDEMDEVRRFVHNVYELDDYVTLHGFQNKDYINEQLSKASLYLMTSHTEAFPIVLIEAMAFGLPCIAFDSAQGAREIIQDGYNGYLIKKRNFEDYAFKVLEVMQNEELRKELGKNARKTSLQYSEENEKKAWISLLEGR